MINNSEFHITKNMPITHMRAILDIEGICPICQSKKTLYTTKYRGNWRCVMQNSYVCKDCGTEWVGNSYDSESFDVLTPKENAKKSKIPGVLTTIMSH